jgi:hypothetical protein
LSRAGARDVPMIAPAIRENLGAHGA